ncbi:hypothetical protein [Streptomyces sp. NPDC046976]|uniref:hypothetical protein n=1 Tax=Streptomyces sp. NPDC046976 TaxID=3155258 RepID=UPI0033FE4B38
MTETPLTTPGLAADEALVETARRVRFPLRLVRASVLDGLRADLAQADQDVTTYTDEAEKWFGQYTDEADRADRAETELDEAGSRVSDLEAQVEELSERLAEAGREVEYMRRVRSITSTVDASAEGREGLLRAAYRYPHESNTAALIADHLPYCEACVRALPNIATEVLIEAARITRETGKVDALWLFFDEGDRRRAPATTAGKKADQ